MSAKSDTHKHGDNNAIVIRDRRKPNQYTTDNIIAREWLPILRIGDAFFFYSVYLSMANRETESSWGSLRTMARYLQCGVDLVIRGNKLLEICELVYIEQGNQHTSNEYYILDPPSLTPELLARIHNRLDALQEQETSKNWQSWVRQVRKALKKHRSLPAIWAQRRANKGGRPVKTIRAPNPARETQAGFSDQGGCEPQPGSMCTTNKVVVSHNQGDRVPQAEQEQLTSLTNKSNQEKDDQSVFADVTLVRARCRSIGVVSTVTDILLEKYPPDYLQQQLDWLPARQPRDPAAMLVSAIQEGWACPVQYDPVQSATWWEEYEAKNGGSHGQGEQEKDPGPSSGESVLVGERAFNIQELWEQILQELELQMTRATFDTWLRGSSVVGMQDDVLVVRVRDQYAAEWLDTRLALPINRTVEGVTGRPLNVRFEGAT